MYHLFGPEAFLETVLALLKTCHDGQLDSLESTKIAYTKMLNRIQPKVFRDESVQKIYVSSQEEVGKLVSKFHKASVLTDKKAITEKLLPHLCYGHWKK